MSQNYSEIEVKLYCPDLNPITQKLSDIGAKLVKHRIYERNVRYENADKSFSTNGIVLRLRRDDNVRLTYKSSLDEGSIENGIHRRFEAEVTISDFDTMDTILRHLSFTLYMVYEKYRTTYKLNQAEIVLDEMPYGQFVEIEAPDETHINHTIEQLGLQKAPRIQYSYAVLFDIIKQNLNLNFTDLTFENFSGIDVPEQAFYP